MIERGNKKGQVSIFVILAIVIVVAIVLYFIFKDKLNNNESIPQNLLPVYQYYESCIQLETENAIDVAGAQGGLIETDDYVSGSEYAPFSTHLNFLGFGVKYWYYLEGNGIIREEVPSKDKIEDQMETFISEGLRECDFSTFYEQGFEIEKEDAIATVTISENKVDVSVEGEFKVSKDEESASKKSFEESIDSKFGKFYELAKEIYFDEKKKAFLEKYAVDTLYLNAPLDGVELQCGPKIWSTQNVFNDLRNAMEQNIGAIKLRGSYYTLKDKSSEYFIVDKDTDEMVNFVYSAKWPTKIEVNGEGVDDEVMIAQPFGTQEGLGVMGFCYVPYHFVYDMSFPVLIQIYDEEEMFQFPIVVVIDKNLPRTGAETDLPYEIINDFELCDKKTEQIEINLYDVNLNKVNGNLSFECFDKKCRLGESKEGVYKGMAPACLNGYVDVRASGYADKKQLISTNKESFAEIILDREYDINLRLKMDGKEVEDTGIITFKKSDGAIKSAAYPEQKEIKLSEGNYEMSVYIYGNTTLTIPASSKSECVDVAKEGLLGMFGGTKEKCFDVNIPETKLNYGLVGGGKLSGYILESDLEKKTMEINVQSLPKPKTLDELSKNFEVFETRRFDIIFL